MKAFIIQYWVEWFFGIVALAITAGYRYLYKKYKETAKENNAIADGIRALLHDRIMSCGKRLVEQGYCTPEEFEEFEYIYHPYANLNGNGTAERMRAEVRQLPSSPPDNESGGDNS